MSELFVLAFVSGCSICCCFANCGVYAPGGKKFITYDDLRKGWDAKTACEDKGGRLAMPKDKEQVTFLHALDSSKMWIGGSKEWGSWMWVDGQPMPLTNENGGVWAGDLGDGPSGNGKCLQIGWSGAVWDDVECGGNKKYACEFNLGSGEWQFIGDRLVKKSRAEQMVDFDGAKQACIEDGGFLITDDTPEIHEWLKEDRLNYWIGASDMEEEGVWKWHGGPPYVTESHWSGGAPDNRYKGEHCAVINSIGEWDDVFCGERNAYACEKPVVCQTEKKSKRKVKYHWKH